MSEQHVDVRQLRREYLAEGLQRAELAADPLEQFSRWFAQACQYYPDDASSMTLATASLSGMPAARIVLLKHFDHQGFAWYTDQHSAKGRELAENPQAELLFYWYGLERQVRISGQVEILSGEAADEYFQARPIGSQLSAMASWQSQPIDSRETLEQRVAALQAEHPNPPLPRPERWGGYRLVPQRFEFWQGRENRLHDRFVYTLSAASWQITRLQP